MIIVYHHRPNHHHLFDQTYKQHGLLDYIDHHPNNQLVIIVPIIITLLTKPACSAVSAPWTLTIADLRSPFLTKWTHSEEYFDASGCCGQIMKVIDTIVILHNIV